MLLSYFRVPHQQVTKRKRQLSLVQGLTPNRRLFARGRNKNTTIMLQEALILALFTLRYIQHYYSSLEIQNAFKKPTIKPWFFTLQRCQSFQIASEWLPSNPVLCVNIQRLKLSRNPWSCGVCCIALSRTSSPGGGCSPGPQGGALSCCTFPSPWDIVAAKWQLCPLLQPRGTFPPHLRSQMEELLHKPSEDSTRGPLRALTLPAEEGHGKILKQKVLIWNPNYLAVSPANSGFIKDCVAATIQWHLDLLLLLFFAAFRFFLKWWRVQDFRNINVSLLEIAKFSTMTLWKLTVQFIDSVLRFSTNLVPDLSQSYFCLMKPVHKAPMAVQQEQGSRWPVSPGTLWLVSLFHDSITKTSLLCKSKITFILQLHSGSWT